MSNKRKTVLAASALIILCVLLVIIVVSRFGLRDTVPVFEPKETVTPTPTPMPTPAPTPAPKQYIFTFVGDNTITNSNLSAHFDSVVKGDMSYCYKNVRSFFADDDMTFGNLECIISDKPLYSSSMFHFKAPVASTQMLTKAGFEFMTCANNHMRDYGSTGVEDTRAALTDAGINHGFDAESVICTTDSGVTVGVYCAFESYQLNSERAAAIVSNLRSRGAEIVIFALHWGNEGCYRPTAYQTQLAHCYIDAGCDIVYGSHPHVLQPVEEYGGGLIMYSLGNFCFGGNSGARDMDSAIVRVSFERDSAGKPVMKGYELIPCRFSSIASSNDYCPTPYVKGSTEYDRVISKLDGSFTGPDIIPDYSFMDKDKDKPDPSPTPEPSEEPSPTPEPSEEPSTKPSPEPEPSAEPEPEPEILPEDTEDDNAFSA